MPLERHRESLAHADIPRARSFLVDAVERDDGTKPFDRHNLSIVVAHAERDGGCTLAAAKHINELLRFGFEVEHSKSEAPVR